MQLYIGLMSGTSMDGIDGVVMDLDPAARFRILGHLHQPFASELRQSLFCLNVTGDNEIHRAALAANGLARAYAQLVYALLHQLQLDCSVITAVGAHGQTIRHRPGEFDGTGYTCQLLNGALLAELSGLDVVCDFRSRDVAAGGQGAPLVPAFHRAAFAIPGQDIAVLNLGGIANITLLHADGRTSGHDCGPGNVLLDTWCAQHTGEPFDAGGRWAFTGQQCEPLLLHMLQEPYLRRSPPKSTGRDLFNAGWLNAQISAIDAPALALAAVDVQATLGFLTACAAANDLRCYMPGVQRLLVCGGGALNSHLLAALQQELPAVEVLPIQAASTMQPMQVEAAAFAWLAWAFTSRQAANCIDVTGAIGPRLLGALYPG